eukprot:scaffold12806_cov104-Isochrysis_galbana.AAC.4
MESPVAGHAVAPAGANGLGCRLVGESASCLSPSRSSSGARAAPASKRPSAAPGAPPARAPRARENAARRRGCCTSLAEGCRQAGRCARAPAGHSKWSTSGGGKAGPPERWRRWTRHCRLRPRRRGARCRPTSWPPPARSPASPSWRRAPAPAIARSSLWPRR